MSLILLAGGNSTRLNTNKAFLRFNDKFLIEIVIDKLVDLFDEILIIANNDIEKYDQIIKKYNKKITVKNDLIKDKGPLGGIYTGLSYSKNENNFIMACDMPFVNVDLVKFMLGFGGFDVIAPRLDGFVEPLHAVYSKNILPLIENQLKNNKLKISEIIEKINNIRYIEKEEIGELDKEGLCFFNVNDNESLEKARLILNEKGI